MRKETKNKKGNKEMKKKMIETPDFTVAKYARMYKGHEIYKDTVNYWMVHKNTGIVYLGYWTFENVMKFNIVM